MMAKDFKVYVLTEMTVTAGSLEDAEEIALNSIDGNGTEGVCFDDIRLMDDYPTTEA